jgi:hemolysin type calcium-binding protein
MQRRRSKTILAAGVAALALAAAPAAAQAAEVSVNGSTLEFKAAAGERNFPQLAVLDANTVIVDETLGISLVGRGPNCGPSRFIEDVQCVVPGGILSATFDLGDGNDQYAFVMGLEGGGPTTVVGGPGIDSVSYRRRSRPVKVTLSQGTRDDGTIDAEGPGLPEGDDISGVEQAGGGSGDDQLFAGGETGVELDGGPGNDIIGGSSGSDVLIGFIGSDIMSSGASSDMIDAEDGRPDTIDCGSGTDTSPRDAVESSVVGCELATRVGILRLSPKRLALEAGRTGTLAMSWTHPRSWRKLRSVTLRVRSGRTVVGSVRISPRADSVRASGRALRLDDRSVRMKRAGKRVSIRVRMRPSAALTARRLAVDVEAIDVSGRKERERGAGALHVRR